MLTNPILNFSQVIKHIRYYSYFSEHKDVIKVVVALHSVVSSLKSECENVRNIKAYLLLHDLCIEFNLAC